MMRTSALVFVVATITLAAFACSSGSTGTNGNPDFAGNRDMMTGGTDLPGGDGATATNCNTIQAWCSNADSICAATWTDAQQPATWCKPNLTVDIYIATTPCGAGYNGVALVSSQFASSSGRYYFYNTDGTLATVGEYDPNGNGDVYCAAGPNGLAQTISSSGCTFANPVTCLDGVLQ